MKSSYINTSQTFLHYEWQKWNSNKLESKTGEKKSKTCQIWDQKLSSEIHHSTSHVPVTTWLHSQPDLQRVVARWS